MKRIAHFNDGMRDGLKGSVFFDRDNGFVNGKQGQEKPHTAKYSSWN